MCSVTLVTSWNTWNQSGAGIGHETCLPQGTTHHVLLTSLYILDIASGMIIILLLLLTTTRPIIIIIIIIIIIANNVAYETRRFKAAFTITLQ